MEPTLRNFAPVSPFVLRWQYPLMVYDGALDPSELKKAPGSFEAKYNVDQLVEILASDTLTYGQIMDRAKESLDMSKPTANRLLKEAQSAGNVVKTNLLYRVVSRYHTL